MTDAPESLKKTPLNALHRELKGKLVPFAGYEMPVQYEPGILKEHLHTRAEAGLFDVSHMGQARLWGEDAAVALETLVPADIRGLKPGRMRYTQFTSDSGGILDDLMVINAGDHLMVVVNAARKDHDFAHLRAGLGGKVRVEVLEDAALIALQGPAAAAVMGRFVPSATALPFLGYVKSSFDGRVVEITRSGYTGEDGFEMSCPAAEAETIARRLLAQPEVAPIGLGARDSLRLEAGLCLYGHDIDETTTPVEAALEWSIQRRRREDGGFPGADTILKQLSGGAPRRRVGLRPLGRAPAREGTEVATSDGRIAGRITSGGFGPTVNGPVAMGYVETPLAAPDTACALLVRGKPLEARVAVLPFVATRYHRG